MNRQASGGIHAGPVALAALARWNANQASLPRCGAKRKKEAGVCTRPAMKNGRCAWHGGLTPRGDKWHQARWPKASDPRAMSRMVAKLRALQKAAKERAARLARMTDEEIAAYRKWHAERPVGSAAKRAEIKRLKKDNAAMRKMFERATPAANTDPDYLAICERIDELKAKLAEMNREAKETASPVIPMKGVFG